MLSLKRFSRAAGPGPLLAGPVVRQRYVPAEVDACPLGAAEAKPCRAGRGGGNCLRDAR